MIRRPRSPISPRSARATAIRSRWRAPATGRAARAEALGRNDEARAHYEAAARYSTAYYGQIARARLGHKDIVLRPPPEAAPDRAQLEVARAIELLYAIDERDLIAGSLADLGERSNDPAGARGDRRGRRPSQGRARHAAARQVGARARTAARALCLSDHRHSRTITPIGPAIEPAVVYAIARQESTFNPRDGVERARHGPDAGHAGGRPLRRQEVRGDLRREAAAERPDLQRAAGRGRARRPARRLSRLLHPDVRRLQCRAADA